jgi:hypothetical protein
MKKEPLKSKTKKDKFQKREWREEKAIEKGNQRPVLEKLKNTEIQVIRPVGETWK